jgi:hypothetical protein
MRLLVGREGVGNGDFLWHLIPETSALCQLSDVQGCGLKTCSSDIRKSKGQDHFQGASRPCDER